MREATSGTGSMAVSTRGADRAIGSTAVGTRLHALLVAAADADGVICPDVRALAARLGESTPTVRAQLREQVVAGTLVEVAELGVYVIGGVETPQPDPYRTVRADAHTGAHNGPASAAIW